MNLSAEQRLLNAWGQHQKGQLTAAMAEYRSVLEIDPSNANGWCYLGIALHDRKQYSQAVQAYQQAIKLKPEFPIAWNNMGNSLRFLLAFDQAELAFAKALELQPQYANAFKNRAALRATQGNIEQACRDYEHALTVQPNDPELHRNVGVLKLSLGEFDDGWLEYRWRWQCRESVVIHTEKPKWTGSSLAGQTLFLYSEQGLGDTMQFIRYPALLKQRRHAGRVVVQAQAALAPLLRAVEGIDRWYDEFDPISESFDTHCSLIDCADLLNTRLDNIPSCSAYIAPAPYLMNYWASYLQRATDKRLRIGLAWQGNRDHQADMFRSVKLSIYRPLLELDQIAFFSLQQGFGSEQISQEGLSDRVQVFPAGTDQSSGAFMDTAAIISQLDLVITTDTSIAHLAGAIGKPCWVLLNKMPDWRWLLNRSDSPWYPSLRLFRQQVAGEWSGVIDDVKTALTQL